MESDLANYYRVHTLALQARINDLKKLNSNNASAKELKQAFAEARFAYKKLAVLSEYFDPYETTRINSPAIQRAEDDNPDKVLEPEGLQVIEQFIYGNPPGSADKLTREIDLLSITIEQLEKKDRSNQFSEDLVWDALRSATLSVITNGITGADSPIAKLSLPEAAATLDGMREIVNILEKEGNHKADLEKLSLRIETAIGILSFQNDFDRFDRLEFIRGHLDPLYGLIVDTRIKNGISAPQGNSPVNYESRSIFDPGAFNINFFGPSRDYWVTQKRIDLGRKLFSDPILSANNDRSCASCHQPSKAFADGMKTPLAIDNKTILKRNTPTLLNAGLQTRQFYDSRTDILENQLDEVVHNASEMGGSLKKLVVFLKKSAQYSELFKAAYENEKDPITPFIVGNAISSYVRSLKSLDSRFDKYMRGDPVQLSASEKNGFNLFAGKAKCASCHFIPLFNGLSAPGFSKTESEVIGVPATKDKRHPLLDPDEGKFDFTASPVDKYSFKTPTLRNIELTAPYMHNGVFNSLMEVMDFYNKGGGKGLHIAPVNQTLPFDNLKLTRKEKKDIISFLRTLTDTAASRIAKEIKP